jgi:hypothetical protein
MLKIAFSHRLKSNLAPLANLFAQRAIGSCRSLHDSERLHQDRKSRPDFSPLRIDSRSSNAADLAKLSRTLIFAGAHEQVFY